MAEELKEKKDFIALPAPEVKQSYKVKKEVTVDKLYKVGSTIELLNGKLKEVLISNKFI